MLLEPLVEVIHPLIFVQRTFDNEWMLQKVFDLCTIQCPPLKATIDEVLELVLIWALFLDVENSLIISYLHDIIHPIDVSFHVVIGSINHSELICKYSKSPNVNLDRVWLSRHDLW